MSNLEWGICNVATQLFFILHFYLFTIHPSTLTPDYIFTSFHLPRLKTKMAMTASRDSLIAIPQYTPTGPQASILANV